MLSQHVILRVVNGRTLLPTRTLTRGEPVPQFSVGSRGDWIVSGAGVASFHVLLMFDGEHVFAASVDPAAAPVYLQGSPIGNTWHAFTPATELRFGDASLVVAREASIAPPAGASPPRPPKPEHRDAPLPPVTVRHAPVAAKHTGPGNTQFFDNLKAQLEAGAGSAPPPPPASADAIMAAVAPTLARQPTTFPMQPPVPPMSPSAALQSTAAALQPAAPQSAAPQSTGLPQSAAPPPMISAPEPWQPVAPPVFAGESLPTAFSPRFPGDTPPGHLPNLSSAHAPAAQLPNLPGGYAPVANLPTLASDSTLGSQPPTPGWSGRGVMELPTHFAPAGSIALPPEATPTAIAPTDDGAPLPLGMPFAAPPLPMPPNAEGEPFSTVAADADAIRNFAARLPPSPPDPPLPPMDAGYPPQYMHSQSSFPPPDGGAYPPQYMHSQSSLPPPDGAYPQAYLENQTPPPYAPPPRFSHNPRAKQSQGAKWLLIVILPLLFALLLVALAWFLIAR